MIANVSDYINLFRTIAYQHLALRDSFYHGDSERIIGAKRSTIKYPVLWLETPNIQITSDAEGVFKHYKGAFVVLHNSPTDDYDRQDQLWSSTQSIAENVIAYLLDYQLQHDGVVFINTTFNMQPLSTIMVDGDYGWRIELAIKCQCFGDCNEFLDHFKTLADDGITAHLPTTKKWIPYTPAESVPTPCDYTAKIAVTKLPTGDYIVEDATEYKATDGRDKVTISIDAGGNIDVYNTHSVTITAEFITLLLSNNISGILITMDIQSLNGCAATTTYSLLTF